jgi:malonyl-CoA O-methyltransferase
MALPDFQLDRRLVRRRAARAAESYAGADFLAREVARRMGERLDYIRVAPRRILDLGCGPGADQPLLRTRYPEASYLGVDFAVPMLRPGRAAGNFLQRLFGGGQRPAAHPIAADAQALPLARASVSLVWSNLMLNWLHDPMPALQEIHRVLEVNGLVMFSTLGPDTLKELRAALPAGRGERVHRFIDMHDLGDALVKAGFSDPVMDMEVITLTYADLDRLFQDLRDSGSTNAAATRPRGLAGRREWAQARAAYQALAWDGRLPATFEVIQGHAWKMPPKVAEDGRAVVHFAPRQRG